MKVADKQY